MGNPVILLIGLVAVVVAGAAILVAIGLRNPQDTDDRILADLHDLQPRPDPHDLMVAATALTHDYGVLTENTRHFGLVPGLTYVGVADVAAMLSGGMGEIYRARDSRLHP